MIANNVRERRIRAAQLRAEAIRTREAYHRSTREAEAAQRAVQRAQTPEWAELQVNRMVQAEVTERWDGQLYEEINDFLRNEISVPMPEMERESLVELYPGQRKPAEDWSVLNEPGVRDILERAARKVAAKYDAEEVDLYQEAALLAAGKAEWVRAQLNRGKPNHVFTDLSRDLMNLVAREHEFISLDAMLEADRDEEDSADLELADGDEPLPPQKVRNGEFGGKMMGLRWCQPNGDTAGGRVTVRRVA